MSMRQKGGVPADDAIPLQGDLVLHFTGPKTFAVVPSTYLETYKLKPLPLRVQPLANAVKLAHEHAFTAALNLKSIPPELLKNLPPEARAFTAIVEGKTVTATGDLEGRELQLSASWECAGEENAADVEATLRIGRRLALAELQVETERSARNNYEMAIIVMKFLEKTLKETKITRKDEKVTVTVSAKIDFSIAEIVEKLREEAARTKGRNNLKQIGLALHNFHSVYNHFPAAAITDKKGKPLLSWRVAILPYIEQDHIYQQFKLDEPWDSENNKKLIPLMASVYATPGDDPRKGLTRYRGFVGNGAFWDYTKEITFAQITDGLSNTIAVVEATEAVPWTKPDEIAFDPKKEVKPLLFWTKDHSNILIVDGSVRTLSKKMADQTIKDAITIAGGEVMGADWYRQ